MTTSMSTRTATGLVVVVAPAVWFLGLGIIVLSLMLLAVAVGTLVRVSAAAWWKLAALATGAVAMMMLVSWLRRGSELRSPVLGAVMVGVNAAAERLLRPRSRVLATPVQATTTFPQPGSSRLDHRRRVPRLVKKRH